MLAQNRSLPGILRLLMKRATWETLTRDEYDAITYYQGLGYYLEVIEVFDGDESVLENEPDGYLFYQAQAVSEQERIIYYLMRQNPE